MAELEVRGLAAPDTPADAVAELARVAAVKQVLADYEGQVRGWLETRVRELGVSAGGQFTLRADAGQAYIAGGNAKVRITDAVALAGFVADGEAVEWVEDVDVEAVRRLLADPATRGEAVEALAQIDAVVSLPVFREGLADELAEHHKAVDDKLVTEDGEVVPGVAVSYSRETLTVKPDRATVGRLVDAMTRPVLGAAPEPDGGAR